MLQKMTTRFEQVEKGLANAPRGSESTERCEKDPNKVREMLEKRKKVHSERCPERVRWFIFSYVGYPYMGIPMYIPI